MVDLACPHRRVAVISEVSWQRHQVFQFRCRRELLLDHVDTVPPGIRPGQQTGAGGHANRRLAMGIGEQHASARQAVNVRRLDLRMSVEASHPIIQIVDGDEKDIGPVCRGIVGPRRNSKEQNAERNSNAAPRDRLRVGH